MKSTVNNCHLSTVEQYQEQNYVLQSMKYKLPGSSLFFRIPRVSLSQSPLLPLFPFSSCMHVIDCRDVVVVMSIFMNFYVFKKMATLVAIVDT